MSRSSKMVSQIKHRGSPDATGLFQAMSMFSSALASGQLGPLLSQFGLPAEAVDAANRGGNTRTHTLPSSKKPLKKQNFSQFSNFFEHVSRQSSR